MASHEDGISHGHPHTSETIQVPLSMCRKHTEMTNMVAQSFKVFRDTFQGPSLQLNSPRETFRHLEDEVASAIQPYHPTPSPCQSFVCDSPTLPGLDGTHDVPHDIKARPGKRYNKSSPGLSPLPLTSPEANILTKNNLKVNLSPRAAATKRSHEPTLDKLSSRTKRRLLQEENDDVQHSRKSPKLKYSTSNTKKDLPIQPEDDNEQQTITENHKKALDSIVQLQAIKSQEDVVKDTINEQPSTAVIETQAPSATSMENFDQFPDKSFDIFNGGDITTPRPSAMYNFNSAIRMLNPFKAVGNLFGRLSAAHSPSKSQRKILGSEDIAKQVDDHLQHFEDRLFDRLVAFQVASKSGTGAEDTVMSDASSPPLPQIAQELNSYLGTGPDLSPLHKFGHDLSLAANLSPLLPVSQFKNVTLHSNDLQQLDERNNDAYPSPLDKVLQSPTEERSKRIAVPMQIVDSLAKKDADAQNRKTDGSVANSEIGVEAPRLRNKASQHLKKMASKMNLRSRKSKANDDIPINNNDYRIMKKKNKDEILRDYLMLQREKQELEKQLVMTSRPDEGGELMNIAATKTTLPSGKTQTGTDFIEVTPILLEATIPDLRVKQKRSKSPDSEDVEQTRTKRRTTSVAHAELPVSSPLASMNGNVSNTRQPQPEDSKTTQIHDEGSSEKDRLVVSSKMNDEQANHVVKKVPPVPAVPSKYRSRVPKPARAKGLSKTNTSDSDWKGWDSEIF